MNLLLKSSLTLVAAACLISCGGGGEGGGHASAGSSTGAAASASSMPPQESTEAGDPSLALIAAAARADQAGATAVMPGSTATPGVLPGLSVGGVSSAGPLPAGSLAAGTGAGGTMPSAGLSIGTLPDSHVTSATASTTAAPAPAPAGATSGSAPGAAAAPTGVSTGAPAGANSAVPAAATAVAKPQPGGGGANAGLAPVTTTRPVAAPMDPAPAASQAEPPLADCGLNDAVGQILRRLNELRARGGSCGAKGQFAPAPALAWDARLYAAASGHSTDMAVNNYFAHLGPAGQAVRDRVVEVGYAYRIVAENIAAGQPSVDTVVAAWMASDGHCSNLMHPAVRDVALACASEQGATYPTYWTLNLAASR